MVLTLFLESMWAPFDVLMDIGWISLLLIIGNLMRRFLPQFQKLLIPAPTTAGLLGLRLGPNALGIIQFSEHFGDYATILIAAVFGALPFTMDFRRQGAPARANDVVLFRGHVPDTVGLLRATWREIFCPTVQYARLVWLFGGVALIGGLALLIPPIIMLKKSKARAS